MIGISKLYCGTASEADLLRYGRSSQALPSHLLQFSKDKRPVVVWNCTKRCNLRCQHCYSESTSQEGVRELSTAEALAMIDDLAGFGAPVLLISGGEPLTRPDLTDLAHHARHQGMRVVLSTNGTLISPEMARRLKDVDLSYVGVSLDGVGAINDRFRGVKGAFDRALAGVRACRDQGIKVGLRFTIHKGNVDEIPLIFRLMETEGIPRVCFYHLVYSGRGSSLRFQDLDHDHTRRTVDLIINETARLHGQGGQQEVLTVDNHADGVYVYLRMLQEANPRAEEVLRLLRFTRGNSSGVGLGCITWEGDVHPDQFWSHYSLGNVLERPFSAIWEDLSDPLLAKLRDRHDHLKGRCHDCRWLDICNGNFRVRAEAVTGDIWSPEPACYLSDEEIGLGGEA